MSCKKCGSSYNIFRSFKSHLLRHHPHCVPDDFKPEILGKASDLHYSDATESILSSHFELSAISLEKLSLIEYQRSVVLFILKMQEKCLLPDSTMFELINGMTGLQQNVISLFAKSVNEIADSILISDTIISCTTNQFCEIFNVMKSQHLKNKFLKENLKLVEPIEYELKLGVETSSYQYVPILKNIQVLCENTEILDYVMSEQLTYENLNNLTDIYDGMNFKNNHIFQSYPCIQIILYFDEFMVSNLLRGNQTHQKLAAFYYVLGNIPHKFRSVVKYMQLALLCKSVDIKKFGFNAILEPLINDIKILENDGIKISGVPCHVKGSIVAIIGDNLAAHQIGGYTTCFSGNTRCCRFCLASHADMQTIFRDSSFVKRSQELHRQQLSLVKINCTYSSIYG